MDLWKTRDASWSYLKEKRPSRLSVFIELLQLIDRCVDEYEARAASDTYARVCGVTLLKAKNLALGSFSLLLDGLGQEAGALLRPMIEYTELLTYFRRFPEKTEKVAEYELPKAGKRAKLIEGIYHGLREHLNEHASHSSYSHYSLSHLLTPEFTFRKMQQFVPEVLDKNVTDLAVQIGLMLQEAILTLERIAPREKVVTLATEADQMKEHLFHVFELEAT